MLSGRFNPAIWKPRWCFNGVSGLVAQSVEQRPFKPLVLGSSPSQPTTSKIMVCERCKEREANTHLTVILEKAGETEHHLCEVCYPEFEAYRNKTYNTQVATPL